MQTVYASMAELMPALLAGLQSGGNVRLGITGTSMTPLLRNGKDSVLLRATDGPARKGDILLYQRQDGRYVLHRVIGIYGDTYLCCGDNQWRKETVCPDQVLAVVCGYYRGQKKRSLTSLSYWLYTKCLVFLRLRRYLLDQAVALWHKIKKK